MFINAAGEKSVTREQFDRLEDLLAASKPHIAALKAIEKEVLAITGDEEWGPGPSSDYVWEDLGDARALIKRVGIQRICQEPT